MAWLARSLGGIAAAVAKKFRTVLLAVFLALALLAAANYAFLLNMHSEQDNCSFGSVSNEQYRAYLAEAKHRQRTSWPRLSSDSQELTRQLNFRLSDLIGNERSLYRRLAIMHAVLRAAGAHYLNTNGTSDDNPYEAALRQLEPIIFNYEVDTNRLVWFQLYPRQVWILAVLAHPTATRPEIIERDGALHFSAHALFFPDLPADADKILASVGGNCPPTPNANAASRYETMWK
jgi:hypothetical protein